MIFLRIKFKKPASDHAMRKAFLHRFMSLSLRTQLLFLALLLALPAIILIVYSGFEQRREYLNEGFSESNRLVNEIVAEQYNQTGDVEQMLSVLAQIPVIQEKNAAATSRILADILNLNQQFGNIIVTDRNGDVWASALPMAKTFSVKSVRSFYNTLETKQFSSGEYTVGKISNKRTIGFGYPILNADSDVESIVLVNFNFDRMNKLLTKAHLPVGSSFTLVDYKGIIIDRNLGPDSLIGTQEKADLFQRMKNGPVEDSFIGIDLAGTKQIISTRKLTLRTETTPYLYFHVAIPLDETLRKAQWNQFRNMAVLFPFLLGVVILVLEIGKRCFVTPIGKLQEATRLMAQGDLNVRTASHIAGGELENLAQAFDCMAGQLAERDQALRKSEGDYRFLADNSADIIWRLDSSRRITFISPADEKLRGFPREEVLGKRLIDLMPKEDAERLTKINDERLVQEKTGIRTGLASFEAAMYCKNGDTICVEVLSSPVRDENGIIIGSHGVARDIRRRKKIEEEREILIKELQQALAEIKSLSGMLPICSSCKKIRDDKGYWNQLEQYISEHTDAMFSHSYCPECAEKIYEEISTTQAVRRRQKSTDPLQS